MSLEDSEIGGSQSVFPGPAVPWELVRDANSPTSPRPPESGAVDGISVSTGLAGVSDACSS